MPPRPPAEGLLNYTFVAPNRFQLADLVSTMLRYVQSYLKLESMANARCANEKKDLVTKANS